MNTLRLGIDGISQATPLDTFKTSVRAGHSVEEIMQYPILQRYSGGRWLAMGKSRPAGWRRGCYGRKRFAGIFPSASSNAGVMRNVGWLFSPDTLAAPQIHLLSGATMLGAFFILTDPVTASTTNRGRLIFGALAGLLVWMIRSFGGYPDGVALPSCWRTSRFL